MQKIIPHLWFDDKAEEAASFYTSIFKNSRILETTYYGQAGAEVSEKEEGSVMTVTFEIEGQQFIALNGGPEYQFTPAISFLINCETQEEIDELWEKLSEGGEKEMCGWVKDKYGVSWQVVPAELDKMIQDEDKEKSEKVMGAMLKMNKIDISELKKAAE